MNKFFSYIFMSLSFLGCTYLNAQADIFFVPKTLLQSYRAQHIIQSIAELTNKECKELFKITFIEKNAKGNNIEKTEFIDVKYYERMKESSVDSKALYAVKVIVNTSKAYEDLKKANRPNSFFTLISTVIPWWK